MYIRDVDYRPMLPQCALTALKEKYIYVSAGSSAHADASPYTYQHSSQSELYGQISPTPAVVFPPF